MQKYEKLLTHDGQITGVSLVENFAFFFNNSREVEEKPYDFSCYAVLGTEAGLLKSIVYVFVRFHRSHIPTSIHHAT